MKRYLTPETFAKEKELVKNEIIERMALLEKRKEKKGTLIPAFAKELEELTSALSIYDELELDFFTDIPGDGLTNDWTEKILKK